MAPGSATEDCLARHVHEDKVPWYRKRNLRILYLLMLPACLAAQVTTGFDGTLINGLQAIPTWEAFFDHPRSAILGILSSLYSLGSMCSLPFAPLASDKLGRRRAIALGSVFMMIGAALQTASQDFAMFVVGRFLLGAGNPFVVNASVLLIGELAHPKERARLISLHESLSFAGSILAAGVTLGTFDMSNNWGWRIPSMLQVIPSLLQITFIWFLPESPRSLICKRRGEDAYAILAKYHAEGDSESNFIKLEYTEIETTLEDVRKQTMSSWKELVSTPGMRRRVLIASFMGAAVQWSGTGLIVYYLPLTLNTVGVHNERTINLINLALMSCTLVSAVTLALIVPKWKRRTAFLISTIAATAIFVGWTIASAEYAQTGSQAASWAVIVFVFLYNPALMIGYGVLTNTYLVELFPFKVRAKGLAVTQGWYTAAGFFNQFVNPVGIHNAGWKYYIVYCVILSLQVVFIYFLFPETANRSLEQLRSLYEGGDVCAEQSDAIETKLEET